ncbi:MAG: esterase-like activity of phytase family protein [Hyphomicrobiales bacterium]
MWALDRFGKFVFALTVLAILSPALANDINVTVRPVPFSNLDESRTKFGELEYLGGLVLRSKKRVFGGFSGILVNADGSRFIATSDRAWWFRAHLVHQNGRLTGIAAPTMGPLLNSKGKPFKRKRNQDAESIAFNGDRPEDGILVGFEREPRIELYQNGITGKSETIKVPKGLIKGPDNKELEAVGRFTSGTNAGKLIAISERNLDKNGNVIGYLWKKSRKKAERFSIRRRQKYSITDVTILEGGDIVLLERRLGALKLPSVAMRLVAAKDLAGGGALDGRILMEASAPGHSVDNMEGLSAHRDAAGRLIFTLISDDNFNRGVQRTLLMQFSWPGR